MQLFSFAELIAILVLMPECPCRFPKTARELCARFFWNNDSMSSRVSSVVCLTDYADGTCFKRVLVGHSSALPSAHHNPLLSVFATEFRFALRLWEKGPSLQATGG